MQGISLTRNQAELAYKDALKKRFPIKQQTQASYRELVKSKYIVVEGVLDTQTIKNTVSELKRDKKFSDLKKYYDTVKQDLIHRLSLFPEEASSVINYAIHQ
jgi:hypothetical protein